MNQNLQVKIDYLSVTYPLQCEATDSVRRKVEEMVELISNYLNIKNYEVFEEPYATNNFKYQFKLGEYIILRLDGPLNDSYQKTCHLELKGEGCRDFEKRNPDKTWLNLILTLICLNAKFKRIDIAIDDYKGQYVTQDWIQSKINQNSYTSIFRSEPITIGNKTQGQTIQFGSHSSNVMLVIYDKLQEQKRRNKETNQTYWVRYEMRFRNHVAKGIITKLINSYDDKEVSIYGTHLELYAYELLYTLLDIKEDNHYSFQNQYRANTDPLWSSFLSNVSKGKLPKPEPKLQETFESYMEYAVPYISMFLFAKYVLAKRTPYLFEIELYKFMATQLKFSKQSFHKLNLFLKQYNISPVDNKTLQEIKTELLKTLEEKELPF